ncbi:MAG TPA: winged helix-turn-helix domain-containing protein [Bryobacteraceae bacterium]
MYRFGPFRFDPDERLLLRGDQLIALPPKALETLRRLLEHRGRLVEKDDLIKAVWPDTFVEEGALVQNVFRLRKALGEGMIETVPRRGYRFGGEVELIPVAETQAEPAVDQTPPLRRTFLLGALGSAAVGAVGLAFAWRSPSAPYGIREIHRLTRSGKAKSCAISPDERLVAYVMQEPEGESLWMAEVAGGNTWRALAPGSAKWGGIGFSADGSRLYVVRNNALQTLLVSGGGLETLQQDVDEAPAFSPDGRIVAFVREDLDRGESAVIVSTPQGADSRRVATRRLPDFYQRLAWRPDGKTIVASAGAVADARNMGLAELDLHGSVRPIGNQRWHSVSGIGWSPKGDALYVTASERRWTPGQLWRVAYPAGAASLLVHDVMQYSGISASREGLLATTGGASVSTLAVVHPGDRTAAAALKNSTEYEQSPVWLPGGRIVYESLRDEQPQIWIMNEDGGARRQLTRGACASVGPAAALDGRLIVFVCECASSSSLWSMDANGANLRPICSGIGLDSPSCTPDGRWVFYISSQGGKPTLWKASLEQRTPIPVTTRLSRMPAVSPDGRWVAFYFWDERDDVSRQVVVAPIDGSDPKPVLNLEDETAVKRIRWSPDGQALYCLLHKQGATEVWRQPVGGGAAVRLTDFRDDRTSSFDVAPDGGRLVCARVEGWSDVLLLRPGPRVVT